MNRITVITSNGLNKLIAGVVSNFAGTGLFEKKVTDDSSGDYHLYYTAKDSRDEPLVILQAGSGDSVLPSTIKNQRYSALSRILSFAQRSRSMPIVIPHSWKPYRHADCIGFFAVQGGMQGAPRWIAQVRLEGSFDLALWDLTTSQDKQTLSSFVPPKDVYARGRELWLGNLDDSHLALQGPIVPEQRSMGVEVVLDGSMPREGLSKSRTISEWMSQLTPRQAEFVEAPTDRSIRLRGPAGSGKTLTMALKAVREAQRAKETDEDLRILFATHSWSLAGEVDDVVRSLSEYGDLDNITVLPLVSVAEEFLPAGMSAEGLELIGDDSFTGKYLQLTQIEEVVDDFLVTDWITFL